MFRMPKKLLVVAAVLTIGTIGGRGASAKELDLTVARFIECTADGTDCMSHNGAYEKFMTEYAFGISPKLMSPASTLGYSGFYLGLEGTVTPVPSSGTDSFNGTNYDEARWRVGTAKKNTTPPGMFLSTIHVRKGLPWSFEVGSSIGYLANSRLVALGGEIKWSLFEGYRKNIRGVLPDLAVRGTVNRVIGQIDVDMTLAGIDGSISYPFGISGAMSLEPYAGYQYMWAIVRTEPVALYSADGTLQSPSANNYDPAEAGMSGPNLGRSKIFGGFVFRYEYLVVTMDWTFGLPQSWKTEQNRAMGTTSQETVSVKVPTQVSYSFGVGVQF